MKPCQVDDYGLRARLLLMRNTQSRSFEIRIILNILLQLLSVGAEQIFTLWGGVQLIIYERGRKYDPTT